MRPPNKALEAGPNALANEEAKQMDVDPSIKEEEDNGEDKIPQTQDDLLDLPDLDSAQVKVEEPNHHSNHLGDEV